MPVKGIHKDKITSLAARKPRLMLCGLSLISWIDMFDENGVAGFKNHVGFYPHPAAMEKFSNEFSEYKKGKGSV